VLAFKILAGAFSDARRGIPPCGIRAQTRTDLRQPSCVHSWWPDRPAPRARRTARSAFARHRRPLRSRLNDREHLIGGFSALPLALSVRARDQTAPDYRAVCLRLFFPARSPGKRHWPVRRDRSSALHADCRVERFDSGTMATSAWSCSMAPVRT